MGLNYRRHAGRACSEEYRLESNACRRVLVGERRAANGCDALVRIRYAGSPRENGSRELPGIPSLG